jgi:hypothetical protein
MPINASKLLQQVRIHSLSVRNNADHLLARQREPFQNDWESDGDLLDRVRIE